MTPVKFAIAIDGPAASGKSSTAKLLAKKLGMDRLDSGLLYRAITYLMYEKDAAPDLESPEIKMFVENLWIEQAGGRIYHGKKDITDFLRTPFIDSRVGVVAKEGYIREKAHKIQNSIIESNQTGIIVDGRDIGTVVMPNAFLKVFITANEVCRAKRRARETEQDFETVLKEIQKRDHDDITRKNGPLKKAEDAILIYNDELTLEETVDIIFNHFHSKKKLIDQGNEKINDDEKVTDKGKKIKET